MDYTISGPHKGVAIAHLLLRVRSRQLGNNKKEERLKEKIMRNINKNLFGAVLLAGILLSGTAIADNDCSGLGLGGGNCKNADLSETNNEGGEGGDAEALGVGISVGLGVGGAGGSTTVEEGAITASNNSSDNQSNADVEVTDVDVIDADNSEGLAAAGDSLRKGLERHAESAAEVRGATGAVCDVTGLSGQTGVAGGGLATVSETCRALRLSLLRQQDPESMATKLAAITHYAGWLPRTILHIASFGVLN